MENKLTLDHSITAKLSTEESFIQNFIKDMPNGHMSITMPNGRVLTSGNQADELKADIRIIDNRFFKKVMLYGDVGFGEAYVEGYWETSDITKVISWALLNHEYTPGLSGSPAKKMLWNSFQFINRLIHNRNANSKNGSRKNISYHYDLSNDFYSLWLDDSMTYSSAYFENADQSLRDAQEIKYAKLAEKLQIKNGDRVLEIGCGWGGMAIHLASNFDIEMTAVTISKEQFHMATERINQAGLGDKVKVIFEDYRNLTGKFDKIVSIEMLEAVGHKYYKTYFKKIHDLLNPHGILAVQVITSPDSRYADMRKGVDWIQKHIFPGSLLPSIAELNKNINKTSNLHLMNLEEMGLHYSRTLKEWRENFNMKLKEIKSLGFNEEFIRKWNYYLAYCEAAFEMRNINVVQMVYAKPNNYRMK